MAYLSKNMHRITLLDHVLLRGEPLIRQLLRLVLFLFKVFVKTLMLEFLF